MTKQWKCDLCRTLDLPKKLAHIYYTIFPILELDCSKSLCVAAFRKSLRSPSCHSALRCTNRCQSTPFKRTSSAVTALVHVQPSVSKSMKSLWKRFTVSNTQWQQRRQQSLHIPALRPSDQLQETQARERRMNEWMKKGHVRDHRGPLSAWRLLTYHGNRWRLRLHNRCTLRSSSQTCLCAADHKQTQCWSHVLHSSESDWGENSQNSLVNVPV